MISPDAFVLVAYVQQFSKAIAGGCVIEIACVHIGVCSFRRLVGLLAIADTDQARIQAFELASAAKIPGSSFNIRLTPRP